MHFNFSFEMRVIQTSRDEQQYEVSTQAPHAGRTCARNHREIRLCIEAMSSNAHGSVPQRQLVCPAFVRYTRQEESQSCPVKTP